MSRLSIDWPGIAKELGDILREGAGNVVQGVRKDIDAYFETIGLAMVKAVARGEKDLQRELIAQANLLRGIHRVVVTREGQATLDKLLGVAARVAGVLVKGLGAL